MKHVMYFLVLACIFATGFPAALDAQDSSAVEDTTATYRRRVLLLPAIGASPETSFLFGGVVVPQFKAGSAGPETRSSSILISAIYTLKNQILTSFLPEIILPREKWVLSGNYYANYFPESYWGVGPFTKNSNEMVVLYTQINLEQAVLRQVGHGIFIGPYLRWSKLFHVRYEDKKGHRITAPVVRGSDGSTSVGFGITGRWDLRNSNMTPTRNHYLEISILANPSWLGSTDPYTSYLVDARKYFDLSGDARSILAVQGLTRLTTGTPPFRDMSLLGGDVINRGYYEGRYRDQNAAQIQAELRQQVIGRLGFTLFAGSGEVWNRFSQFNLSNYKWSLGAGLRFNLNPEDPTNLRIDFGVGQNTSGFYLQFGEAF